jgi:hypothetical protein
MSIFCVSWREDDAEKAKQVQPANAVKARTPAITTARSSLPSEEISLSVLSAVLARNIEWTFVYSENPSACKG